MTGGVVVHTTESIQDLMSAENTAGFISRRLDPGSYHVIVDEDSTVNMMPDSYAAFSVATEGYNNRTFSVAIAARSAMLDPSQPATRAAIDRAGEAIVAFWVRNGIDPFASAHWINEGVLSGPGLCNHGAIQNDRSDAWEYHPERLALGKLLIDSIHRHAGGNVSSGGAKKLYAFTTVDGRIVQFGLYLGQVVHRGQGVVNGGFGKWAPLNDGQPFAVDGIAATTNADGRVDVVAWGPSGTTYRTQAAKGGNWRAWRVE